jgi:hypothetical protein
MHFSKAYDTWWRRDVILTIGPKTYTRETCVRELGCPNFRAASNLSTALKAMKCASIKQLAQTTPKDLLDLDGVGERTVFVALCVLDATDHAVSERWLHSDERQDGKATPKDVAPPGKAKPRPKP